MATDTTISTSLDRMLQNIAVPPVPLADVRSKIASGAPAPAYPAVRPYVRYASAAAIVIGAGVLVTSPGLVHTIESKYDAALRALGIQPPPKAPISLIRQLKSAQSTSLSAAQAQAGFRIVPPTGLPSDVHATKIFTAPTALHNRKTGVWTAGSTQVVFSYERRAGRIFTLAADRFDPQEQDPKFIFEAVDLPGGGVRLVKRQNFVWRNGDQVMRAVVGDGISAAEIQAIRAAMDGTAVHLVDNRAPRTGDHLKIRMIP